MFNKNNHRFPVIFCITFLILSSLISKICSQGKDKTTNWPEPVFEHFTTADGLPEHSVRCILQDHLGYLWFGTQNGLVKYDGYSMKVFQPDPNDSLSISDRQIFAIYEDRSGTLWIGTEREGLNRFNRAAETFTKYILDPDDASKFNQITSICEDKTGKLFVGNMGGLNLFDRETQKFKHIFYQGQVYSPAVYEYILSLVTKGKRISSILRVGNNANLTKAFTIDKKTVVLIVTMGEAGCDDGWLENVNGKIIEGKNYNNTVCAGGNATYQIRLVIDTLHKGNYRLRYFSDPGRSYGEWQDSPPDYPDFWGIQVIELPEGQTGVREIFNETKTKTLKYEASAIIEDKLTGKLYVGSTGRIFSYNRKKQALVDEISPTGYKFKIGYIHSFYQSKDGIIWIGHSRGLTKLNPTNNSLKLFQPVSSVIYNTENSFKKLTEDDEGLIWSGTGIPPKGNGLICFDPKKEQFKMYKNTPGDLRSLSGNIVWSVYIDHSGILWVGMGWAGLNKWNRSKYKFKRVNYDSDGGSVNDILEDRQGIIWFSTHDGLYSFNPQTMEFQNYRLDRENNAVSFICIDKTGIIWCSTATRGLGRFDREKGSFRFYSNDPNDSMSISSNSTNDILSDSNDVLWIGTSDGLNRFDKKTGKFTRYKHDPNNPASISNNKPFTTYEDRNGILWFGTDGGGLNKFDRINESFERFSVYIVTSTIPSIYEDREGNFWIGTYLTGLYLFDRDKGVPVYNITEKDGLANNLVTAILEDDSGNLWIGTNNGLSKFNPKTRTIKNYFTSDADRGNRYSRAFKTSSGEMLFGTGNGFIMFNPDSIKDDPVPPQVVIRNVSLFNRPGEKLKIDGFISEMKELNLSYDENDLRFDYVGLHYADPSKNLYKYKLEGFDKDWVDAGTQRNATYTNLDAGEYTFRVTACNADGVWNEKDASIKIIIPPPFWATWWAYGFYLIFFVSVLYGIRKYEMNRVNWKNQSKLDEVKLREREETDKMKSRFFANISHEFRTPLTLILGPTEKVLSESKENETHKQLNIVKRSANRLLMLINQLLDLSKLEAGKLELKASEGNIVTLIKGLTMSFESIAERKNISLSVKSEKEEIRVFFNKEMIIKVMTNLLSNAFKFTREGGNITVYIDLIENELVEIKVKDTGIGISAEELPKLFDRFYQVDSSQTREYEGTGLGLALTKELVELHRGKIDVKSIQGEGSEFIIELPLGRNHLTDKEIVEIEETEKPELVIDKEEYVPSAIEEAEREESIGEEKNLILIVEDNKDVRGFIKDSLGDDFKVEEASNGEEGLLMAEKFIPDLIISDIMMPKMDGNELTKKIKNDEKTSHIPVILLTAKSEQESKLEGLQTGADDYLIKPFDSKELRIRIKNLIDIRRKLQEKYSKGDYSWKQDREKLSSLDEKFMSKVMEVIESHLSEEDFSIETFDKEMNMGKSQNYRKLKALTGCSPSMYIRRVRLIKAREMIKEKQGNVSEIAYSVGFSSPAYFTRCFKEEFGYSPSELKN